MDIVSLLILAIGLSMDAFAVSVCKGLALKKVSLSQMIIVGLWFGGFQALMPVVGYYLGKTFAGYITTFDHWIAFGLLAVIGLNMVKESRSATCETTSNDLGGTECERQRTQSDDEGWHFSFGHDVPVE